MRAAALLPPRRNPQIVFLHASSQQQRAVPSIFLSWSGFLVLDYDMLCLVQFLSPAIFSHFFSPLFHLGNLGSFFLLLLILGWFVLHNFSSLLGLLRSCSQTSQDAPFRGSQCIPCCQLTTVYRMHCELCFRPWSGWKFDFPIAGFGNLKLNPCEFVTVSSDCVSDKILNV